jgi:hypothetical protein
VTWTIRIPGRPSDPLNEKTIFDLPRALDDPEDREIARELFFHCYTSGVKTVGGVVRGLEQLTHYERRRLLDVLRKKAGLADTATVEQQREYKAANARGAVVAGQNSGWQLCHAPDCNTVPMSELGVPIVATVRRWFCPAHRDQAQPGDMEPRGSGIRISESGALVPVDEGETERAAERAKSAAASRDAAEAERKVEAEERRRYQQAVADDTRRLTPPGVPS